jgi:transcription factor SPT20
MAGYNLTRTVDEVLQHFEKDEKNLPSFTVHLHLEYWTLNNGSKFLYNNPVASLLDDIQAHRIPVDFLELFDSAKVPFYDGCMIVELLDYRPQKSKDPPPEKPERTRVVLHPNSETLWADICLLNQKTGNQWTDQDALEIEARLLLAIAPPLCLDPDPHLSRIANNILRVSMPTVPVSLKRKASVLDPEEDETDKARRAKLMQFMDPRQHRSHAPSYRILEHIQSQKMTKSGQPQSADPQPPLQTASTPTPAVLQPASPIVVAIPSAHVAEPAQNIKKAEPAHAPPLYRNDNRSNTSGSSTPVNGQPVNHYMRLKPNGQQSPSPVAQSPMQPSRASVPTQQQYQQSTQIPSQPTQPLRPSPPQHIQSASPNFQGAVPQGTFFHSSSSPKECTA